MSLVGAAVPAAKEPNKSSLLTPCSLQISETAAINSGIGITFILLPRPSHLTLHVPFLKIAFQDPGR